MSEVKRDGTFVYQLNSNGSNLWYLCVQPGFEADETRVPTEKLEAIAKYIADLLNEVEL